MDRLKKHHLMILATVFSLFISSLLFINATTANTLSFNLSQGQIPKIKWGFTHGYTKCSGPDCNDPTQLIDFLKPDDFRLANHHNGVYEYVVDQARFPQRHGSTVTFVLQNAFDLSLNGGYYGGKFCVGAFLSCVGYKNKFATFNDLRTSWNQFLVQFFNNPPHDINWYDVFAEPDDQLKNVTVEQLFLLYKDAAIISQQRQPLVKIMGPDLMIFKQETLDYFITQARAQNVRLDAITWHTFGKPVQVAHTTNIVKNLIANSGCINDCPLIRIPEYQPVETHLMPGEQFQFLYFGMVSGVDMMNRACWSIKTQGESEYWTTCWDGFNGLLGRDNKTIQPGYWLHHYFGNMKKYPTVLSENLQSGTTAMVSVAENETRTGGLIMILVGQSNFTENTQNIILDISGQLNAQSTIGIVNLPNYGQEAITTSYSPTLNKINALEKTASGIRVTIPAIPKGAANYLVIPFTR